MQFVRVFVLFGGCVVSARARGVLRLRGGASLASEEDKAIYAMGCNVGRQLGDLSCLNPGELDILFAGAKDVLTGTEPQVDLPAYLGLAQSLFMKRVAQAKETAHKSGAEALEAAAAMEGAVKTESGLVIRELAVGEGAAVTDGSVAIVTFEGRLADGTVIDSSDRRGGPTEMALDGMELKGLREGLLRLAEGGKAVLTFGPELGFGDAGSGMIPPGATLVFELEVLEVQEDTGATEEGRGDDDDVPS